MNGEEKSESVIKGFMKILGQMMRGTDVESMLDRKANFKVGRKAKA